jgi:hypothetical protein
MTLNGIPVAGLLDADVTLVELPAGAEGGAHIRCVLR